MPILGTPKRLLHRGLTSVEELIIIARFASFRTARTRSLNNVVQILHIEITRRILSFLRRVSLATMTITTKISYHISFIPVDYEALGRGAR